jgi:hypothetical protein
LTILVVFFVIQAFPLPLNSLLPGEGEKQVNLHLIGRLF